MLIVWDMSSDGERREEFAVWGVRGLGMEYTTNLSKITAKESRHALRSGATW